MMTKSVTLSEPEPIFEHAASAAAATDAGFTVTSGIGARTIRRPEDVLGLNVPTGGRLRVDSSDLIIVEAPLLNEAEQADAREALIADGVFESQDWPARYLDRDFPISEGKTFRFDASSLVLTGIKFGWAIEQAARIADVAGKDCPGFERLEIVLDFPTPVRAEEHLFIGAELQRRGVRDFDLVLPWGGRWEPAVDWIGEEEVLAANLSLHSAIATLSGAWRLSFDHVEQKFAALPILRANCGETFHLNVDGLGWIEGTRIIVRHEPQLLRELLVVAQDRFVFDKPNAELATTEDDIRTLPDVPDTELERVFVEDFRGRQLLRFTASSLLGHEKFGPAIRAAIERNREQYGQLVEAEARRHFAAWRS